jgi:hypothetical protein
MTSDHSIGSVQAVALSRAVQEAFLLHASIVNESSPGGRPAWRVTLDDGTMKHDATVETANGTDVAMRDHRFNVAAYELDKLLELGMVPATVARIVDGRPAAVTWWLDGVAMNELARRRSRTEPPDPDRWTKQWHAVRVFDELVANAYRDINPEWYWSTVWDNLVITKDWRIWLVDHTRTFQTRRHIEHPESLTRCDRGLLGQLRARNSVVLTERLAKYLSRDQLDALEARWQHLVQHFDEQIASRGESAVVYDRPAMP